MKKKMKFDENRMKIIRKILFVILRVGFGGNKRMSEKKQDVECKIEFEREKERKKIRMINKEYWNEFTVLFLILNNGSKYSYFIWLLLAGLHTDWDWSIKNVRSFLSAFFKKKFLLLNRNFSFSFFL